MRSARAWLQRLLGVFGGDGSDRELANELESHLQLHIDDNLRAGMTPREARRRAAVALGGVAQTSEHYRDRRGLPWLEHLLQDLRFGLRMWRRSPAFTAVSVSVLALGLGANILIFALASEYLLKPLPLADPDRVVRAYTGRSSNTVYTDYLAYRDRTRTLSGLGAFQLASTSIRTSDRPERVTGMAVSGNYFETVGVRAALGRAITIADDRPEAPGVAVISDNSWKRRFAGDSAIVGRSVTINSHPYTIVGVAPPGYHGEMAPFAPEVWVPWNAPGFAATPAEVAAGRRRSAHMIGRLQPNVSIEQAQADLSTLAANLRGQSDDVSGPAVVTVYPAARLIAELGSTVSLFAGLLLALVMLVLLIACANIANLMLARWTTRRREIAVRLAIGAGRGRIVRQLLTESLLLSGLGATIGLGLAAVIGRTIALRTLSTPGGPVGVEFGFDWRVALFATAMMVLATALFGLMPALQSAKAATQAALKDGSTTGGTSRSRLRTVLLTTQVALSTLLLVTAALLGRSVLTAMTTDRGFVADRVMTATVDLEVRGYTAERGRAFYDQLLSRLEETPGVQAANIVDIVPLTLSNRGGVLLKEGEEPRADGASREPISLNAVSRGHFRTLGIALLEGRDFADGDRISATPVAIVNETLARRLWPAENAVGRRVRFARTRSTFDPWLEVVGVVRDSKYASVGEAPRAFLYRPLAQAFVSTATLLVKTAGEPESILPAVRAHVRDLDPDLPLFNVAPLATATNISLVPVQVAATLAGALGGVALALAAIGIYGVTSYLARQRTREIGIRLALGARPHEVIRLVTRHGMRWTVVGLVIGLTLSLAASQLLTGLLYGIVPVDPVAFIGVTVLLAATSYAACWIPSKGASRTDPMLALRQE